MILMRILPGVLKELVKHVPAVLFQTVEWSDLASELPKISKRVLQKEGHEDLFQKQKDFLAPFPITLTNSTLNTGPLPRERWVGERYLELYFAQLYSPHGVFLDLRSQHFLAEGSSLHWHPTGFWTIFSSSFRQGLQEVYEGFYLDDEKLYYQGLEKIGLMGKDWSQEERNELANLFKEQFGDSLTEEMKFDLERFKSSIFKTSDFLLRKKTKITKDFLYLGIYLVTLYASLEEIDQELPVKRIFLKVREQFSIT